MKDNNILFKKQINNPIRTSITGKTNTYYQGNNKTLYAISNETGETLWEKEFSEAIFYIHENNNDLVIFTHSKLYCLDPYIGQLKWEKEILVEKHDPFINNNFIKVYSYGKVHQFALENGEELSQKNLSSFLKNFKFNVISNPILTEELIICTDANNKELVTYNFKTEKILWKHQLNGDNSILSGSIKIKHGILSFKYFGGKQDFLNLNDGEKLLKYKDEINKSFVVDSNRIIILTENSKIKCLDISKNKILYDLTIGDKSIKKHSFLSKEHLFIGQNNKVWIIDITEGKILKVIPLQEEMKGNLAFEEQSNLLTLHTENFFIGYKIEL